MKNKILNFNVSTVNNESYIRNEAVNQPIYFRTQQLSDKVKECERLILKFYNLLYLRKLQLPLCIVPLK